MGWFKNLIGHYSTITRHRHMVISYCKRAGIFWQGLKHDLSKYNPAEFFAGVKYYQNGKRSPNAEERELLGYSAAWLHHKGRNKHHYEYWNDFNTQTKRIEPVHMPDKYVVEMFCDRIAASKNYMKEKYTDASPLEYYKDSYAKQYMRPETSEFLEELLTMLAKDGEEKTFAYIRNHKRRQKPTWNR